MTEYRPNSHKSKEENALSEKKIKKVVNGTAKTKTNEGRKLANIFISEDAANVKSYVFMDVLVPAIKKAISDIVTDGVDMILYGSRGNSSRKDRNGNKVPYRSYYGNSENTKESSYRTQNRFDYEDVIFDTRVDAEEVREQMRDVIREYGFVTVADMYDMADLPAPYTSSKYGWRNLNGSEVIRNRGDGYIIKLPKASPID